MESIKLNFLELYEANNWFYKYLGAMKELANRDIEFDYHYYINELKEITEKLDIDNKFDWEKIIQEYENGDNEYIDMILKIEYQVEEILKSAIMELIKWNT